MCLRGGGGVDVPPNCLVEVAEMVGLALGLTLGADVGDGDTQGAPHRV